MRRLLPVMAVALAVAPACKKTDNTMIVVSVSSNLAVPAKLDTVRLDVIGNSKTSDSFPLVATDASVKRELPVLLELVPLGDKSEAFTVTAVGLVAGSPVVAQTAHVAFVSGQGLLLKLFLDAACVGVACVDPSLTCADGTCSKPVAVGPLPPYVPDKRDAGDAGDDGRRDGGDAAGGEVAGETRIPNAPEVASETRIPDAPEDVPLPTDVLPTCRFDESQFGLCTLGP
jgi:hypothetical protein